MNEFMIQVQIVFPDWMFFWGFVDSNTSEESIPKNNANMKLPFIDNAIIQQLQGIGNIIYVCPTIMSAILQTSLTMQQLLEIRGVKKVFPVKTTHWINKNGTRFIGWDILPGYEDGSLFQNRYVRQKSSIEARKNLFNN